MDLPTAILLNLRNREAKNAMIFEHVKRDFIGYFTPIGEPPRGPVFP